MRKKQIHARIKTIGDGSEIVKFTFTKDLPGDGDKVIGTNYHYGKASQCELVSYQNTRDSAIINKYDYYIIPVFDDGNQYVGRECVCVDHVMAKPLNAKIFQTMIDMARECDNIETFLKEAVKSPIWEKEDVSPDGRDEWLKQIYIAAHRTMKDIVKITGLSQAKFGEYFGIPKRSIENWCNGYTTVLPYMLIMMQEILGLVSRE